MNIARSVLIVFLVLLLFSNSALAENSAMEIGLLYLNKVMDLSDVETFTATASGYEANEINFWFDFRDGWHVVMVIHDEKVFSTMPMDDVKILNGLCNLLPLFSQIQAQMPNGVEVLFTVAVTDENKQLITFDNYWDYVWY